MELVQGATLREVLRDGLDPEQARDIGRQVAEALAVAHGAQIVHRDVKPENVMVREDGYVKVLDFGLARVERVEREGVTVSFATGSGLVIGTIGYMSPEQAQGEPVTAASDVFSLGVVLYEALTGQHPFPASSALGVLHAILSDVPVAPSHLRDGMPAAYDQIVLECLHKDPRLRPTALDVANSLKHASTRAAVRATPVPSRDQSRTVVGRSAELAILDEAWAHASSGHGGVVALAGEAGYGKTALVEAFLSSVARKDNPVRIGRGRCSERLAGSDVYLPGPRSPRVPASERKPWQPRSRDEDGRPELVHAARLAAGPERRRGQGRRRPRPLGAAVETRDDGSRRGSKPARADRAVPRRSSSGPILPQWTCCPISRSGCRPAAYWWSPHTGLRCWRCRSIRFCRSSSICRRAVWVAKSRCTHYPPKQ